jgi:predicted nucleic acid-binding protein
MKNLLRGRDAWESTRLRLNRGSRAEVRLNRQWSCLGRLHSGEQEAIALAVSVDAQLLIDERLGRRTAIQLGINVIGSLSILATVRRQCLIEAVRPLVTELRISGYGFDDELVRSFLAGLGEGE